MMYRVVQPYGAKPEEWTVQSEHATVGQAFAVIDSLTARMVRTGAPSDAIELIVVNEHGERVERPARQ
jgi:hypothetical protein